MHWPLRQAPQLVLSAPRTSSRLGYVLITGAASHVKGAWTELLASSPGDTYLLMLSAGGTFVSAANTSMLLDIGIGPASSEQLLISNLAIGYLDSSLLSGRLWTLPLYIPAGSRIAARIQGVIANDTAEVGVDLFGGLPMEGASPNVAVDTYGADLTTSRGVSLVASATANVAGAWTQVSPSIPNDIHQLFLGIQGNGNATLATANSLIDIAVGATGSEVVIASGIYARSSTVEAIINVAPPGPVVLHTTEIKAGTRLSARLTSSVASHGLDATFHGLR